MVGSTYTFVFQAIQGKHADAKKIKRIMDLSEVYGRLEDGSSYKT